MHDNQMENQRRRKLTGRLILIFFGFLLFLTFFSNTINNFSLPRVTWEQPSGGALLKEVNGEGVVEARETEALYARSSRVVLDVKVKPGEWVAAGQELFVLDTSELQQQYKEEEIRYEKLKLALEKLEESSVHGGDSTYQHAVEAAQEKAQELEETLQVTRKLYEAGSESLEKVNRAQKDLAAARKELALKKEEMKKKSTSEQQDIKNARFDLALQKIKLDKIREELDSGSRIVSPMNGIVKEVNVSKGAKTGTTQAMAVIADASAGYEFKTSVDADAAEYLSLGDTVEVSVKAFGGKSIAGRLVRKEDTPGEEGEKKDLYVELAAEGLTGGERGEVRITRKTRTYPALVSNSAVGQDSSGKFVYVIKERKGALGNEYYAQKAYISIGDSDNYKTAVLNGLSPRDRVIVRSDKAVSDSSRLLLLR